MLISKTLLLIASSLALTTPALAQDQAAAAFEYSPIVRLMRSGQFQAEVWRRDVRTDHCDLAWSNGEIYPTAATAMIEACTSLRKNFDVTFSCSRAPSQGVARDRVVANRERHSGGNEERGSRGRSQSHISDDTGGSSASYFGRKRRLAQGLLENSGEAVWWGRMGQVAVAVAVGVVAAVGAGVGTDAVGARHGLSPRASQSAPGLALPEG